MHVQRNTCLFSHMSLCRCLCAPSLLQLGCTPLAGVCQPAAARGSRLPDGALAHTHAVQVSAND